MRIGHGYDAHRFAAGERLVLGGVDIPHDKGLAAHSDGDVVVHALCDALIGAAGGGDIGKHFPDDDPRYENIDSRILLRQVVADLARDGFSVGNADLTVLGFHHLELETFEDTPRHFANDAPRTCRHAWPKGCSELNHQRSRQAGGDAGGDITIMGDREIPYGLLKKIMLTCAGAEYNNISFAVTQKAPET